MKRKIQTELCSNCKLPKDKHKVYSAARSITRGIVMPFYGCDNRLTDGPGRFFEPMTNLEVIEHYAVKKRKYPKEDIMMLSKCGLSNLEIAEYITDYP